MTRMFDKYNKNYNIAPDNRYKFLPVKSQYKDTIVLGAFNNYCFKIPHSIPEIQDLKVTYKQGIELKVVKNYSDIIIKDYSMMNRYESGESGESGEPIKPNACCFAYYTLTPQESLLFNNYNTELKVQLKTTLTNGFIEYSDIYLVKIIDILNKEVLEEA